MSAFELWHNGLHSLYDGHDIIGQAGVVEGLLCTKDFLVGVLAHSGHHDLQVAGGVGGFLGSTRGAVLGYVLVGLSGRC